MLKVMGTRVFKCILWISLFTFFNLAFDLPLYAEAKRLKEITQTQKVKIPRKHRNLDDILKAMEDVLKSNVSSSEKRERIKKLSEEIQVIDKRVRNQFKETERILKKKGLPDEILKRHREFVEEYEKRYKELTDRINAYLKARWFSGRRLRNFLSKNRYKKKMPKIDPNRLPHRSLPIKKIKTEKYKPPEKKIKKIELTPEGKKYFERLRKEKERGRSEKEQSRIQEVTSPHLSTLSCSNVQDSKTSTRMIDEQSVYGGSVPFVPLLFSATGDSGYLSETMEVQFTPEIESLAKELEYNPVKIYEYLRNNFAYEPYYGSLKGAQETLFEKAGNDFDLASLLVALLRVSGIKARYVYGEIIVPIDRAMGWLGVKDPWVAGNILATSGIPARMLLVDGKPWGIRMEHCWVEAYIPWEGGKVYRGAYNPKDIGQARWIWAPMDVSYKEYRYMERIDVSGVPFNENEYLDTLRSDSPFDYWFKSIENYIKNNYPDSSVFHGVSGNVIKRLYFGYIPGRYPYQRLMETATRFVEIPDNYRHKVRFEIMNEYGEYELTYTISCPELAGKSVSLFYAPATASDESTIESYGGLYNTPAYLVNLKPQLRIDNEVKAEGGAIGFGNDQTFTMVFIHPSFGEIDRVENMFTAGAWYGIAFDYQKVPGELTMEHSDRLIVLLDSLDLSDTTEVIVPEEWWAEEFLYSIGLGYFSMVDVTFLFGVPYEVSLSGMSIDVDRDIENGFSVYNSQDAVKRFTKIRGYEGSYWEYRIFELWLGIPSVSTVKALQVASSEGIPIYDIDRSNINDILPQLSIPDEVKDEITNAVNTGLMAKVSAQSITLNDWEGVGYILYDPSTYSGDYRIYGGISGGSTTEGVKKGDVGKVEIVFQNGASVCIGFFKPEEYWLTEYALAKWVHRKLFAAYYNPTFSNTVTKELFKDQLKKPTNKIFYFVGHGIRWENKGVWALKLGEYEWIHFSEISSCNMPRYKIVYINSCCSGDYTCSGRGNFGIIDAFDSECKIGFKTAIFSGNYAMYVGGLEYTIAFFTFLIDGYSAQEAHTMIGKLNIVPDINDIRVDGDGYLWE